MLEKLVKRGKLGIAVVTAGAGYPVLPGMVRPDLVVSYKGVCVCMSVCCHDVAPRDAWRYP